MAVRPGQKQQVDKYDDDKNVKDIANGFGLRQQPGPQLAMVKAELA